MIIDSSGEGDDKEWVLRLSSMGPMTQMATKSQTKDKWLP